MRYRNIVLLLLAITATALVAEGLYRLGTPWSLTQRSGPGQLTLFAITFGGVMLFSHFVVKAGSSSFFSGYLHDWRRALAGFALMFAAAFLAMCLLHLSLGLAGYVGVQPDLMDRLTARAFERAGVALLVAIVLAVAEEVIFRGFLLRYLRWSPAFGPTVAAVLVSAFIFSSVHLVAFQVDAGDIDYLPRLIGLFCLGVLLGTVYVSTGSLLCSIGVHAGLLGFKVIMRKLDILGYSHNELFGFRTDGMDLRMGPANWVLLLLAALLVVALARWLWPRLWIEAAVTVDDEARQGSGFRLRGSPQTA